MTLRILLAALGALAAIAPATADTACPTPALSEKPADGIQRPMALTPLVISPTAPMVYPVLGTDSRVHLAYVVLVTNMLPTPTTLSEMIPSTPTGGTRSSGPNGLSALRTLP